MNKLDKEDTGSYLTSDPVKFYRTLVLIGDVLEKSTLLLQDKMSILKAEDKVDTPEYHDTSRNYLTTAEMLYVYTKVLEDYCILKEEQAGAEIFKSELDNVPETKLKN